MLATSSPPGRKEQQSSPAPQKRAQARHFLTPAYYQEDQVGVFLPRIAVLLTNLGEPGRRISGGGQGKHTPSPLGPSHPTSQRTQGKCGYWQGEPQEALSLPWGTR